MLVLTRTVGQQIFVADGSIRIVVQAVHGKRVRIGIAAPPDVAIHRSEIWQRIQAGVDCQDFPIDTRKSPVLAKLVRSRAC